MFENIPPEIIAKVGLATTWLWEQYGKTAVEQAVKKPIDAGKWRLGIENYFYSLYERVGFVRILGRMESEPLENVFTHVNILDKLTAEQRYNIETLIIEAAPRDFAALQRKKRVAGDKAVDEHAKLFIFGKPGAGKTTFLKHTAVRAINREIDEIPIFVSLKELSDSKKEILPFIQHQFQTHQFPNPEGFVPKLLKDGNAIVLFDGLDEVNLEDERRSRLIGMLNDFVYQYGECPILITCRVAAVDYSFTQFKYVEMADFDEGQIGRYIDQWFIKDDVKRQNCRLALLEDKQNKPVRELAQVPLLLSLLCLVYEERNEFPPQRDEIYEEATRALLSKWDASRNITRDSIYHKLTLKQKQSLLAYIAHETFTDGDYFLPERQIVTLIERYLAGVPAIEEPDGERVLQAMEARHGIFVERARQIHSFSHLTLQEYYIARYIAGNEGRGAVAQLMRHVGDERWREVFLLTAGMLEDATNFCRQYLAATLKIIASDKQLVSLLDWVEVKRQALSIPYRESAARALLLFNALALALDLDRALELARALALARALDLDLYLALDLYRALDLDRALELARALDHARDLAIKVAKRWKHGEFQAELESLTLPENDQDLDELVQYDEKFRQVLNKYADVWNLYRRFAIQKKEIDGRWQLSETQIKTLATYLQASQLLVDCLKVVNYLPDPTAIENQILLPPA